MRPRISTRARFAIALSAVAVAAITAAVIASSGSAKRSTTTLRLLATAEEGVGFSPNGKPQQGDRFGGGATITGGESGFSRTVCTVIGERALCNIQLRLSKGQLSVQGLVPSRADRTRLAVIGGTAGYSRARGTAIATQTSETETRFIVRLRS